MAAKSSGAGPTAGDLAKKAKKPPTKLSHNKKMGKELSPEVQAAIYGALLTGQFHNDQDLAASVGVSSGTITKYKKLLPPEYLEKVHQAKKDEAGDKIGEGVLSFLDVCLTSLQEISTFTRNQEWLFQQDAAGLATLFGVTTDKVIKILDAIERANRPEPEPLESATEGS